VWYRGALTIAEVGHLHVLCSLGLLLFSARAVGVGDWAQLLIRMFSIGWALHIVRAVRMHLSCFYFPHVLLALAIGLSF
jgi:hypothetical protein